MSSLDELYTVTLIATQSLGHLWDGALRGVDGNPPLYLTAAWSLTHLIPATPEHILRPCNLVLLAATAVLLNRIGRRMAAPLSVAAGLAVFCVADQSALGNALLDIRTYALYLFLVTLSPRTAAALASGCGRS